ncbi:ATP-binding protein [Bifidobacterium colobi]|uniref:ATP-binding protein n=1 Tax=Bifidobacterium colobi TaxID=2809026 RepID=UPI001F0A78A4|nr:ATP-binding protein [Bifidobacterium colobi]
MIYLELLRRHRNVYIGKVGTTEVDFYTPDPTGDRYYQVSLTVMDENTLSRELKPLQSINDNHPKTLLTMDRIGNGNHAGIQQINIIDWLLSNDD